VRMDLLAHQPTDSLLLRVARSAVAQRQDL
jgi:hypothetical protein